MEKKRGVGLSDKTRCPFHGMKISKGSFEQGTANQCALNFRGTTPCHMETAGKKIDFEACSYNHPKIRDAVDKVMKKLGVHEIIE